jgi:hypothetical protein
MAISQVTLTKINKKIYKKYPEVEGKHPTVKLQKGVNSNMQSKNPINIYVLTYSGKISYASRHSSKRVVRVVAKENGQILKISVSK